MTVDAAVVLVAFAVVVTALSVVVSAAVDEGASVGVSATVDRDAPSCDEEPDAMAHALVRHAHPSNAETVRATLARTLPGMSTTVAFWGAARRQTYPPGVSLIRRHTRPRRYNSLTSA
jgi:hypothetical protein